MGIHVHTICSIVQIIAMSCKLFSRQPYGLQQSLFSLAACSSRLSPFWCLSLVMVMCLRADMSFVVHRIKLESLFQPLTDALAYYDAVSDTDEVLDSSYSHPLSPCLSSETQAQPPSQPQTDPKSSPQASPQSGVLIRQSSTPRQSPTAIPGTAGISSNGDAHALTSAHHSAATIAESAQQAAAEQTSAPDSQQSAMADAREVKLKGLLEVYEEPDSHAGLYNYAKALEDVEAGLLAGFFYKHFCLASNVIGSESKGEQKKRKLTLFSDLSGSLLRQQPRAPKVR